MADTRLGKIGITVKEPWSANISYEVLDMSLFAVENGGDGCSYVALRNNIGVTPGTDPNTWMKSTQAGQSIYDLVVKYHHFVGTEEEFEAEYQAALQAARNAAAGASAVEAQVEAAETARVAAETGRADAESARQSAEASRASAETARGTAEAARQSAESGRASAETARASAEAGRNSAETERASAEAARTAAEADRVSDFSALKTDMQTAIGQADAATAAAVATNNQIQTAEAGRVSAEQGRVSAENARASAESARATAETSRATAETARATAEGQRATAEGQRVTAENARVSAESGRASAESARVAAEAARVSAETARESQASSDHTRAESDHAIAAEDHATLDEKIAHKADIDGWYGGLTSGAAENLVGRGTTEAEYVNRRTSAGTADIGSGSAAITRIKGRSVVWNQLVDPSKLSNGTTRSGVTVVNNGDGSFTITGTQEGTALNLVVLRDQQKIVAGHKYLLRGMQEQNTEKKFFLCDSSQAPLSYDYGDGVVYTASHSDTFAGAFRLRCDAGASAPVGGIRVILQLIDLTLLGIDNLTTIEEVEAWLAQNIGPLDYYAYNPGEVINNAAEGIKTRGFNLFNYATGKAYLPGKYSDYPYEYEICGTFTSISFTDVNGNTSVPELHEGRFFNVDAPGELTVVGGNNTDTLVHLVWSGWRNEGEPDYVYEPYWESTLNLGLTSLTGKLNGQGSSVTVFPHGLAKVGDVQDEIVRNRAFKRIGIRAYQSGDESDTSVLTDYTNTYYALATPEEYILDNPPQFNYRVDDFSTEETVPSYDPSNVIAPLAYDVQYAMNAVDAIRRLPDNYVERTDVKQVTGDSQKFVLSQKAVNDNYAKKVGVEDNLTVGLAKNIEGNATSGGFPFTFVKISGTDGLAKINDVRGNSLVWNQLVDTITTEITLISGRRYYKRIEGTAEIVSGSGQVVSGLGSTDNIIDLTLMFGAGNEPSTVEEFEALFPLPYYDYNAGSLLNNKTEQVKVVGFNQWDEEWEVGAVSVSGSLITDPNCIRPKNYIPVFPNTEYNFYCGAFTSGSVHIIYYNKRGDTTAIGGANIYYNGSKTFTTPANCYFLKFSFETTVGYGNTYKGDICINLSDPAKNGTYEPYKTNTIVLNLPTLTGKVNGEGESVVIASDGLKSAGSAYDEGIVENGYLTKIVKRIGVVDMGTLTWNKTTVGGREFFFGSNPGIPLVAASTIANCLCSKYEMKSWATMVDKTMCIFPAVSSTTPVLVMDSAYTDAATFKTAMSGVLLYYELAEPITYVLDTPIPATFQSYKGGTLNQIPENGSVPTTAPHAMSVTYAIDAAGILTGLPKDYISKESLQAMLTAMQSAGLFSAYTMTFNASTGKYEFSFTPNA